MLKKCQKCKSDKPLDCFNKNGVKKDGLGNTCRSCCKEYRRSCYEAKRNEYIAKARDQKRRIAKWLSEYKSKLQCEICGFCHPAAIDFHHTDQDKDFDIASAASRGFSKARILSEIAKCAVLCCRCHRILHWEAEHEH